MRVPVVRDFDHADAIGYVELNASYLPDELDWHLAAGYRVLENGYELKCFSVVPNLRGYNSHTCAADNDEGEEYETKYGYLVDC